MESFVFIGHSVFLEINKMFAEGQNMGFNMQTRT